MYFALKILIRSLSFIRMKSRPLGRLDALFCRQVNKSRLMPGLSDISQHILTEQTDC